MKRFLLLAGLVLAAGSLRAQTLLPVEPNPYGERPVIVPVPTTVAGLSENVVTLPAAWERTQVPGSGASLFLQRVVIPAA